MDHSTRERLETAGFVETSIEEWLDLTPEEAQLIETKVRLSQLLRQWRVKEGLRQKEVAAKAGTSQSRISTVEKIARTQQNVSEISVDMILKTLFGMGASHRDIALAISGETVEKS